MRRGVAGFGALVSDPPSGPAGKAKRPVDEPNASSVLADAPPSVGGVLAARKYLSFDVGSFTIDVSRGSVSEVGQVGSRHPCWWVSMPSATFYIGEDHAEGQRLVKAMETNDARAVLGCLLGMLSRRQVAEVVLEMVKNAEQKGYRACQSDLMALVQDPGAWRRSWSLG